MRIFQITTTLSYGDAVGNDVLALDKVLKEAGYKTGVFAENIRDTIPPGIAKHISKLPKLKREDIILYHLSIATPLNYKLPEFAAKKIIIYHNITPHRFFSGYNHLLWAACKRGLEEVRFLADKVDYCLADSEYNKQDLKDLGYTCPIDVLPILIPFDDYRKKPSTEIIEKYSEDGYTNILFTGRIAPNKCQEDIIASFYQYHKNYNEKSRLILVGNYKGLESYYYKLVQYVKQLGIEKDVVFTGHISFDEILAYYHIADVFVCMSEHEGFCVPLVEAMFFDLPIIAFDSSAIADTLGGCGILLKKKDPLETAGIINYLLQNKDVKEMIIQGQRERLKAFEHDSIKEQFLCNIKKLVK